MLLFLVMPYIMLLYLVMSMYFVTIFSNVSEKLLGAQTNQRAELVVS